jgi:hypothetical protein
MTNLFWPVYKSLESEVIELSNKIHFDDNQCSVYSVKIIELLLRCCVEIEAISKDLYFKNGGVSPNNRDLYFDTDCLELLEKKWILSKKIVLISSANFYFQNEDNIILKPLYKANKRGTSTADWKKAYQAVKHNRSENLDKGNIKNLLRAMAGLFILNLYYKDDYHELLESNTDKFSKDFSHLFDIKTHTWRGDTNRPNSYVKGEDFDECVYLVKWTDEIKKKYDLWVTVQARILNELIFEHPKVKDFINNNFIENGQIDQERLSSFLVNREYFNCIDMKTDYSIMIQQSARRATETVHFDITKPMTYKAIVNKNQSIYSN